MFCCETAKYVHFPVRIQGVITQNSPKKKGNISFDAVFCVVDIFITPVYFLPAQFGNYFILQGIEQKPAESCNCVRINYSFIQVQKSKAITDLLCCKPGQLILFMPTILT